MAKISSPTSPSSGHAGEGGVSARRRRSLGSGGGARRSTSRTGGGTGNNGTGTQKCPLFQELAVNKLSVWISKGRVPAFIRIWSQKGRKQLKSCQQ